MSEEGFKLPAGDIQALAGMYADYAAGVLGTDRAGTDRTERYSGLCHFVLLEKLQHPEGSIDPDPDGTAPESQPYLRRYLQARAALMVPREGLIQVLRVSPRAPSNQTFKLTASVVGNTTASTPDLPAT